MDSMIHLDNIHKVFQVGDQEVHALDNVNLEINKGEYLSIMGPSGSGKSTLLNILGLLDTPSSGQYLFEGQDITLLSEDEQAEVRRHRIGFVFQFFHLISRMSAIENVELPLILDGVPPKTRGEKAFKALEALGLADRVHHRPSQLSGGQSQRVAIARATILEPAILLADEPTGNLDRKSGMEVLDLLEGLHQDQELTLVIVTHDPEIGKRAQRHIHMMDGNIYEDAATTESTSQT